MGKWGEDIFDDPQAQLARRDFAAAFAAGDSVFVAAEKVAAKYSDSGVAVPLALAALQLEHGFIHSRLRKKVLTAIITGEALQPFETMGEEARAARDAVLQSLRKKLSEQP